MIHDANNGRIRKKTMVSVPAPSIRCRSCDRAGVVSYIPSERFNTFICVTCDEVVPCHGGFARRADCNRFADRHSALREVAGCLSCGSDVLHPQGDVVTGGHCENCGKVERVPAAGLRFRRAAGWPSLQLLGKVVAQ
jgi:hypothetical protein